VSQTHIPFQIEIPHKGTLSGWALENGGAPQGVALLHGLGDHAGRYHHVGAALAARGLAVQALDLPGHGLSYGRRGHIGSWQEYRDSVTAWMDRARSEHPERRWALFGQSMGAIVALDWAFERPERVRTLVLAAPPFELAFNPSIVKIRAAQILMRIWPGFTQDNMILPSVLSHDPAIVRAHSADPLVHHRISARLFIELQRARASVGRRASELRHDALILHGGDDHVASVLGSERWASSAPAGRTTLRLYPGLYHEVLNEIGRDAIIASMVDWIAGQMER